VTESVHGRRAMSRARANEGHVCPDDHRKRRAITRSFIARSQM
jgi:hypothetical protein